MAELITVKQAVELSGYRDHHIRDLLRTGRVKGAKWGNVWQVNKASLLRYMRDVQKLGDKRGAKPKI
jgi:hypothetical protein